MSIVNVDGLNRMAIQYNPFLQTLPFLMLADTLSKLEINQLNIAAKDVILQFQRKQGLGRPYTTATVTAYADTVGKVTERTLEVKACYAALKEHIMAYQNSKLVLNSPAEQKLDLELKKHPLEVLIIGQKIRTIGEDIVDYLFFGERDDSGLTPVDMFDGFFTQVATEIASAAISAAEGNLKATGSFAAPATGTDTTAWDSLVEFIRFARPELRRNAVLYISNDTLFHCLDALANKVNYKDIMGYEEFSQILNSTAKGNIKVISEPCLGSGDKMLLTVPRNLDFGMNTINDVSFVQVRAPFEDPNLAQFWTQWEAGTRIRSIHPKEFLVNDGVSTALALAGDYS